MNQNFPSDLNVEIIENGQIKFNYTKDISQNIQTKAKSIFKGTNEYSAIILSGKKPNYLIKGGTPEGKEEFFYSLLDELKIPYERVQKYNPKDYLYLSSKVHENMTDKELLSITELNIKEFSKFKLIEKESELKFSSKKLEIPTYIAEYLIWRFNKSEITKFDYLFKIPEENYFDEEDEEEKEFTIPPIIIKLNIPNPIPILFTYKNENKFELTFSSYGEIPVNIIESQINNAIKYLNDYKTYNFYLDKSDDISIEILNDKYLNSKNLFGSTFLDVSTIHEEIHSYGIIIFYKSEEISELKLIEKKIFEDLEFHYCKKCNCIYTIKDLNCFEFYHSGKKIPFEEGDMEIMDMDGDEPIIYYNWSCCGEKASDELGCQKKPNGLHEKDKKHELITSIKIIEKF